MAITVEGPDGATHEFPDGTSPDIIKGVMAQHYARAQGTTPPSAVKPSQDIAPDERGNFSLDNVVRSIANGITFGGADRFAAKMEELTGIGGAPTPTTGDLVKAGENGLGTPYDRNLAAERAKTGAYASQHPVLNILGNVVGNVGGLAAAAAIPGVAAALPAMPETLGARALAGAGAGAGFGAVQGAFETPDMTNIPDLASHVSQGAGLGAALGGAVPVVAKGIGAGYSALADALRGSENTGLSGRANTILSNALQAAGPDAVKAEVSRLGDHAMLADTAPALLGKAQGAALNSDEARNVLTNALKGRAAGTNERIQGAVDTNFGPAADPVLATNNLKNHLATVDQENYGSALADPPSVDTSHLIDSLNKSIDGAEGMEKKALVNLRDSLMMPNPAASKGAAAADSSIPSFGDPKPQSLLTFLQRAGGVRDEGGDLASMGYGRYPGLINKNGLSMDAAREAAAEQGYLGHDIDHAMGNTDVNDLIDRLGSHPTYSAHDEELLAMRADAQKAKELQKKFGHLYSEEPPVPDTIPKDKAGNLHKIKQEIDNVINYDTPGLGVPAGAVSRQQGALKQARGQLNSTLETQVPGYQEANDASSALRRRIDAIQEGTGALDSGKTAMTPEALAAKYAAMEPGERAAFAKGARGEIERILDTRANDLVAGKNVIKGEGDWNRERLSTIFGEDPTNEVISAIDREGRFHDTHQKVVEGSQTAQRTAAANDMKPWFLKGSDLKVTGIPGQVVKSGVAKLANALPFMDRTRAYGDVARGLSAQGAERDKLLSALVENLARKGETRATGDAIGNRAAMAAALAAFDARHTRNQF